MSISKEQELSAVIVQAPCPPSAALPRCGKCKKPTWGGARFSCPLVACDFHVCRTCHFDHFDSFEAKHPHALSMVHQPSEPERATHTEFQRTLDAKYRPPPHQTKRQRSCRKNKKARNEMDWTKRQERKKKKQKVVSQVPVITEADNIPAAVAASPVISAVLSARGEMVASRLPPLTLADIIARGVTATNSDRSDTSSDDCDIVKDKNVQVAAAPEAPAASSSKAFANSSRYVAPPVPPPAGSPLLDVVMYEKAELPSPAAAKPSPFRREEGATWTCGVCTTVNSQREEPRQNEEEDEEEEWSSSDSDSSCSRCCTHRSIHGFTQMHAVVYATLNHAKRAMSKDALFKYAKDNGLLFGFEDSHCKKNYYNFFNIIQNVRRGKSSDLCVVENGQCVSGPGRNSGGTTCLDLKKNRPEDFPDFYRDIKIERNMVFEARYLSKYAGFTARAQNSAIQLTLIESQTRWAEIKEARKQEVREQEAAAAPESQQEREDDEVSVDLTVMANGQEQEQEQEPPISNDVPKKEVTVISPLLSLRPLPSQDYGASFVSSAPKKRKLDDEVEHYQQCLSAMNRNSLELEDLAKCQKVLDEKKAQLFKQSADINLRLLGVFA